MLIDSRKLKNNSIIEGDICIIGAGAAGISIALDWIDTPYKVLLLESGDFEFNAEVQSLYKGNTSGQQYYPLDGCRMRYFGGTTAMWGGYCSPFDEIDFRERDWVNHSGWPIELSDLNPFYKRAAKILELKSSNFDNNFWKNKDSGLTDNVNFNGEEVYEKMWQFSPPTRFGSKYKKDIIDAKNINLITYANVTDIIGNQDVSNIEKVSIKNHAGKNHEVRAKYFIIACGGIENARLLLASNNQIKEGLGNENDLVGRFFLEHIELKSGELWLKEQLNMDFYMFKSGETIARAELAISTAAQEHYKILNGTVSLSPLKTARHSTPAIERWEDGWISGKGQKKSLADRFKKKYDLFKEGQNKGISNAFELYMRLEQSPNPDSRITLDLERDSLGVNKANLNWMINSSDKDSIRAIYHIIGRQVGILNKGRVKLMDALLEEDDLNWPSGTTPGCHRMGTTRMSNNPERGVVDKNCKIHNINNLYVAGSSCFPTAGSANPTYTLIALSLRVSDEIKERLKNS